MKSNDEFCLVSFYLLSQTNKAIINDLELWKVTKIVDLNFYLITNFENILLLQMEYDISPCCIKPSNLFYTVDLRNIRLIEQTVLSVNNSCFSCQEYPIILKWMQIVVQEWCTNFPLFYVIIKKLYTWK